MFKFAGRSSTSRFIGIALGTLLLLAVLSFSIIAWNRKRAWDAVVQAIHDCRVIGFSQNHSGRVTIELKNAEGRLSATQLRGSDIRDVTKEAFPKCGEIQWFAIE